MNGKLVLLSLCWWASLREVRGGFTTDPAGRRYFHDAGLAAERDLRGTAGSAEREGYRSPVGGAG